jgi:NarL family two-component system response regulator LiaR
LTRSETGLSTGMKSPPRPGVLGEISLYAGGVNETRPYEARLPSATMQKPNMQQPIRVMIVDAQATVRSGLKYVLLAFDDLELVAEASTDAGALTLCAATCPDVVLMDLQISGVDPAIMLEAMRRVHPAVQVVALISLGAESTVREVMAAGATGHVLKNVSAADLARAIRKAHSSCGAAGP